jgi:hypothetical protein
MPTPFDVPRDSNRVHIEAVHLDALAIRLQRAMLRDHPTEVAFRLACCMSPGDTALRVSADDAPKPRPGGELRVQPAPSGGPPCVFAHTHVCLPDRSHSPPSLNDLVSLINDVVSRVTDIPFALVAACEPGGARVYLYDCVTAPARRRAGEPVEEDDLRAFADALARARASGDTAHAEAIGAVLEAVGSSGLPFDVLAWPALRRPSPPKRWVEYAAGAALALDRRCSLEIPEWMEPYCSPQFLEIRSQMADAQLDDLTEARRGFDALRRWHVAIRDVPLATGSRAVGQTVALV